MSSPYRSAHIFSPTRRNNQHQNTETLGTSVNIATAFSNSRNGSYSRRSREPFDPVGNEEEEEDDDNVDYLDIRNINHEAIKNDPELRDLSKNPAAFNDKQDNQYYNNKLEDVYEIDVESDDDSDDDDDDEFGVYGEVERLVHNPAEERRQRLFVSQMSISSNQNVPNTPRRTFSSSLESNNSYHPKPRSIQNYHKLHWQDTLIHNIYLILKPVVFLFFMIFWIVKEPVIRIVTFFTMVVSSVAVDPLLYIWSRLQNNQNWMPTTETRRKLTHWCTAILLLLLSASVFKYYNSDQSLSETVKTLLESIERPVYYNQPSDFSVINRRLASMDHRIAEQSKSANNEYTKLWSTIHNHHNQFTDHLVDTDKEYTKIWTAIEEENARLKELQHKIDHDLRETIEDQLPNMILVRTDKDGKLELSPQFYKYLQDASFWKNFIKQNKQAIDEYLAGEMSSFLDKQQEQGAIISKDAFMKLISNDLIQHQYKGDSSNLNDLIQIAITNYHQDVLNTPDFALESRGARILHSKTSATYQPLSFWLQRLYKSLGLTIWHHPPELAIRPSINVGDCWTMDGSEGTLGILLSQPVHVQCVTIDHPSTELLLNGTSSAPKDLEFFGLSSFPQRDPFYVPLGSIRYDIENSSSSLQTFDLQIHPTQSFRAILVKVNSNWGNPDHTDIYRIRIHGLPAEK